MDADWITIQAEFTKKEWRRFVVSLPLVDDPRWMQSIAMRNTWEWLERISNQVRRKEHIRQEYSRLREKYLQGKIRPDRPNVRRGYCALCTMPLPKGEGMKYEDGGLYCVLHDPQYEHCPQCDDPMIGVCNRCE